MTTQNMQPQSGQNRRGTRAIIGLFGAPLMWILQMSLCEPLAANACSGSQGPFFASFWLTLPLVLRLVGIGCALAGLLSGLAAWNMWRDASHQSMEDGRTQFLAKLAMMSSFVFIVAIIFTACAAFLVSPCQSR